MKIMKIIPPPAHALLILFICKGLDMILPRTVDIFSPTLGTVIALPGLIFIFWAWIQFFLNKTTPIPNGEPSALVTGGPYRYTRNPMYLGLLIILASLGFFSGSPVYLLSPVALFFIIDRLFIPDEEAKLEQLFDRRFAEFKLQVKRWL